MGRAMARQTVQPAMRQPTAGSAALMRPKLVFMGWDVATPAELLTRLNGELRRGGFVDDAWLEAVLARERRYPTGLHTVAAGIALPHADAEHVTAPFIAIVKPQAPVTFEPMAGLGGSVSAELVICLGVTHAEEQVAALQGIMDAFASEERARAALAQTTPQGLIDALTW